MFGEIPVVVSDVESKKKKKKKKQCSISLTSSEILRGSSSSVVKKMKKRERVMEEPSYGNTASNVGMKLSTDDILRIAGTKFIRCFDSQHAADNAPSMMLRHPFESSFYGLSIEETKNVELVELLLSCAARVDCKKFELGSKLLGQCELLCSATGNPVQRVVYYLCQALRERIDKETGRLIVLSLKTVQLTVERFDIDKALMTLNPSLHAYHQNIPFCQLAIFAGIQAIIENVRKAKKVHIIDLGIRSGSHWTVLMQALASSCHESQLELLKITAVGTSARSAIEETGERLLSFAKTMNIPLSFKIVMVPDMSHLKEDLFELDCNETVAVYSSYSLRIFLSEPDQLEHLMKVVRNLNPCVMVLIEMEGNHNSPVFVNRFVEALFFYGTMFDCFETCMERNDPNRMLFEATYCFEAIRNIVATEGEERKIRIVKIDVWRAFFARFGMEELELSPSSIYQANLIADRFPSGTHCNLEINGKCLMMGWKGTPVQSLSVWRFHRCNNIN